MSGWHTRQRNVFNARRVNDERGNCTVCAAEHWMWCDLIAHDQIEADRGRPAVYFTTTPLR